MVYGVVFSAHRSDSEPLLLPLWDIWHLDWNPQPGACLEVDGQTYLILERRHRYLLQAGRYQLHKIALYVQTFDALAEGSFSDGHWVIGDMTCRYNARSALLRYAVNPVGPCDRCVHYQPIENLP